MNHVTNVPIEAHETNGRFQYENGDHLRLSFFYHKGLIVGSPVAVFIEGVEVNGLAVMCKMLGDELFKVEVAFYNEEEAHKARNYEQIAWIRKYAKDNALSVEEATIEWVSRYASSFPKE